MLEIFCTIVGDMTRASLFPVTTFREALSLKKEGRLCVEMMKLSKNVIMPKTSNLLFSKPTKTPKKTYF